MITIRKTQRTKIQIAVEACGRPIVRNAVLKFGAVEKNITLGGHYVSADLTVSDVSSLATGPLEGTLTVLDSGGDALTQLLIDTVVESGDAGDDADGGPLQTIYCVVPVVINIPTPSLSAAPAAPTVDEPLAAQVPEPETVCAAPMAEAAVPDMPAEPVAAEEPAAVPVPLTVPSPAPTDCEEPQTSVPSVAEEAARRETPCAKRTSRRRRRR